MEDKRSTSVENVPAGTRDVKVSTEPVALYKILKFEAMVASGGEAKAVVAAGHVLVNGKIETQKRKKIMSGDQIEFAGEKIRIQLSTIDIENKPENVAASTECKNDQ